MIEIAAAHAHRVASGRISSPELPILLRALYWVILATKLDCIKHCILVGLQRDVMMPKILKRAIHKAKNNDSVSVNYKSKELRGPT